MTKDELLAKLQEIQKKYYDPAMYGNSGGNSDPESTHAEADEAILEFIGDNRITELHEELSPWCA